MAIRTISALGCENQKEGKASGTITPGMLLERTSTSGTVKAHATASGIAQALFALEDDRQGNTVSDNYTTGNRVFFVSCKKGDEVYALIADGQNIAIGDFLVSNGNGYLKEYSVATIDSSGENVVGVALEALDMSDSSGADPSQQLCRIEIM